MGVQLTEMEGIAAAKAAEPQRVPADSVVLEGGAG
jgi:hypothetical protein